MTKKLISQHNEFGVKRTEELFSPLLPKSDAVVVDKQAEDGKRVGPADTQAAKAYMLVQKSYFEADKELQQLEEAPLLKPIQPFFSQHLLRSMSGSSI